jgi:serine/threonine-protein kinase
LINETISHYKILGKLGAGGMGEVYRAEDLRLHRQVAVKVLPDVFAADPERLARFEREAKLLAALSHPNIAAIHGLEEAEGKRFLILELVEGETLAQRLRRGPLPIDEALDVCRQIAEGLEAAHEKNIVHRDLKPSNVKITPEGKVKILDFGLARVFLDQSPVAAMADSPTITAEMTQPGVVLGTAAYMSPEQAKGKPVDKRVDIWAFGCILFECLTGKAAFPGETITEVIASILKGDPDWNALPKGLPANVRGVLRRCLQKDRNLRYHDIADARIEIAEELSLPSLEEEVVIQRPIRAWIMGAVIGGLVIGIVAAFITWHLRPVEPPPSVSRSILKIEPGHWLDGLRSQPLELPTRTGMAMASDGSFVVYSAIAENPGPQAKPQIYLRRMDRMDAVPVAGTEGGISPFLSPDDRWIGFWEGGKLKKVFVGGGVPAALCDVARPFGVNWGPDDHIVFSSGWDLGLSRVSGQGGNVEVLTVPDKTRKEYGHRLPRWLPDGRNVLFTIVGHGHVLQPRLALLDLGTRTWRVVMEDAADGLYLRTGHLVFMREGMLMAVAFDLDRLEVRGQPVPVVASVMHTLHIAKRSDNTGAGQYCVSDSGSLAYVSGEVISELDNILFRVDQTGTVRPAADTKAPMYLPRFSPDGRRIAYDTEGREERVWVYDIDRGTASRLTDMGSAGCAWTPDGKRLAFSSPISGQENLYWQTADGSSAAERLTTSDFWQIPGDFAPDGSTLAFVEEPPETGYDILILDMKSRRVTPFLKTKAYEGWPDYSPDGRWLAYASDESGRMEVWVRPFPGPGGRWQVSKEGGREPIWSKDGRQLFYREADRVWAADVRTDGGFSAGKPRLLFEKTGFFLTNAVRNWDLYPDGRGFLMMKKEEIKPRPVTEMILVQNWFEELKRLVPTGKK